MSDSASGNGQSAVQAEMRRMGIAARQASRVMAATVRRLDEARAALKVAKAKDMAVAEQRGISTDKLHARSPVGLNGLTTEKYVVFGNGEIRHR